MAIGERADVVVIGAGIFGLSVAWSALAQGLSVTVLEAAEVGAGASGGLVGALSPHVPEQWNGKKAFQLTALLSAERHWAEVAAVGGSDPGYRRTGRWLPLRTAAQRARALERAEGARLLWQGQAAWQVRPPAHAWLAPGAAAAGIVHETLTARLRPRAACVALAAAVRARGGRIVEGCAVRTVAAGRVETLRGAEITADRIVVAAGAAAFGLLAAEPGDLGSAVKGQAALLRAPVPGHAPVIFDDGVYVVPQGGGRVAVGSTSERDFADPDSLDSRLDPLLARARALCPALRGAAVVERWAGLRPKARRRDPMLGPVPGLPGVWVAGGGFKIGLGIAHHAGRAVAEMLTGGDPDLPDSFSVSHHARA
ncbi:MAG: FAD-binding oxidoreductase [Pseudomonadota bacterium]